jgi:hypothetical protein
MDLVIYIIEMIMPQEEEVLYRSALWTNEAEGCITMGSKDSISIIVGAAIGSSRSGVLASERFGG